MKSISLWLATGLALALMVVVAVAAADLPAAEASLTSGGTASEVNRGPDGTLYVSEAGVGKVWAIQPDGAFVSYSVAGWPLDAQPDSAGDIWWTNGAKVFGRINVDEGTQTTWDFGLDHNLWGLAIDANDRLWMTDWTSTTDPRLYGFDPQASELCTYTLPGGTYSTYVVHEGGRLWLGNRLFERIMRFDPLEPEITWWEIPGSAAWPMGLAVDRQGNVWWADLGLDAVGRLDPASGQMTLYELPAGGGRDPQMVELRGSRVWVTGGNDGTVRILDPQVAGGQVSTVAPGSGDWSQVCADIGAGSTASLLATATGSLTWTSSSLTPSHEADGWSVYPLPSGALPYGLAAASDYVWVTDPGRDSLYRFEPPLFRVFLPLVSRQ